jgi:crotonobetainyl-CoA:carnitine CoA-transferase CaiB-like acyl-CoA transferase
MADGQTSKKKDEASKSAGAPAPVWQRLRVDAQQAAEHEPARLSATPGEIGWLGRDLGADTDAVLAEALGYTPQQLDALHARGII